MSLSDLLICRALLHIRKLIGMSTGILYSIDGETTNTESENTINLDYDEYEDLYINSFDLIHDLYRRGILWFDKENKKYKLSPSIALETMEKSFGFEDIAIKQKKNICESRLDVDIRSEVIKGVYLNIPLIAANMSTVVNADFCIQLYHLGALGIMHRALSDDEYFSEIYKISQSCEVVAASIGVGDGQFELAKNLYNHGANVLCIDIAHGYSDSVISLAKKIKDKLDVKIIVGNTTNPDILHETHEFVDAIKVGIAQGFACETKNTAGCTEKQFSAVYKFKELSSKYDVPIISDGGIREAADFTKSIGAGANSVMAGKIFAACPESAAELVVADGKEKKLYAGMASRYVQNKWKGGLKDGTCPEGGVRMLELGESLKDLLTRYSGALRSGITYAGARDIKTFHENVEFVKI